MLKRRRRLALGSRPKKRIEVLLLVRVLNDCAVVPTFSTFLPMVESYGCRLAGRWPY